MLKNIWMVGYVMNKYGFGMNCEPICEHIIKRNTKFISCTYNTASMVFHYMAYIQQKKKLFKYMKTLNQIKNTFWGLEQEICWDWLYKQQEGNIYGKTSENFMYFNMFFLKFLFRIIIFYLIDYVSRSINEIFYRCTWE